MDKQTGSSIQWGYTRAFRAALLHPRVNPHRDDAGKWISFLPASMPPGRRQEVFDALAHDVFTHPQLRSLSSCAKMALRPLALYPHRIALMFYCDGASQHLVLDALKPVARAHRRALLKSGELSVSDKFLRQWAYKSDAQTTKELEAGKHDAQTSLMMLFGLQNISPPRPPSP